MRLKLCLLLSIFPLINSAFGSCREGQRFTCFIPQFERMLRSCNANDPYTLQELEAARKFANDRGNQYCRGNGTAFQGDEGKACGLFNEVYNCFNLRITSQAQANQDQAEMNARVDAISRDCSTGTLSEQSSLIEVRVFLGLILNRNCGAMPRTTALRELCDKTRSANTCVLGRIERLGEVNNSPRDSGKDVPSRGTPYPSSRSRAAQQ